MSASAPAAPLPGASPDYPGTTPDHDAATVGRMRGRRLLLARAAWLGVAALVVAIVIVALTDTYVQSLQAGDGDSLAHRVYAAYEVGLLGVTVTVFGGVAALLVWRRSDERMALFSALALVTFPGYAFHLDTTVALAPPWRWSAAALSVVGVVGLTLLLYLFPDGRFVPRWSRWLILPWLLAEGIRHVVPGSRWDYSRWPTLPFLLVLLADLGPAVGVMVYRYRCVSNSVQRQQTKWFVWGVTLAVGTTIGTTLWTYVLAPPALQQNLLAIAIVDTARVVAVLLVPLSIGVAIARYRLWAIDLLLNRTLVYGALTASVIVLYVLVVGALSTLVAAHRGMLITLVAIGVIAAALQPLRVRLQREVNRLLYGERDDPYQVLSHLGRHLEESLALAPEAVLSVVVETIAHVLKLPYVAVALRQEQGVEIVAAHGTPVAAPIALSLVYRQEPVGQLLLAPRVGSDDLSPADYRLFADLTRQVAVAVHAAELAADAAHLTAALQQARTRLVTLREEGRRRLRRDLHDGLGPALACIALQAEAARELVRSDPAQADAALADLAAQAQAAIADIRRVVYELRPPALDDLGLVGAVRAHACRLSRPELCITVEAPEDLPPLPAAVEVAAYRIAQEALTNVVRHAAARTCTVRLRLDDTPPDDAAAAGGVLCVDVSDDGRGLPAERRAGVGLRSMGERAAELGGSCTIDAAPDGGTRVAAQLPIVLPDVPDSPDLPDELARPQEER